jgi:hypothetical protein
MVLATSLVCACNVQAADRAAGTAEVLALIGVPAPEMPAKAAELVKAAKVRERGAVTVNAVTTATALNAAGTPTVVSAIAKAVPDMAAIAAGTAAGQQPKQAVEITRAAVTAAPGKAGKIVAAVCRVAPQDYRNIAQAAAQAAPGMRKEILQAVAGIFPELKAGIETALAGSGDTLPSVAAVLDSVRPSSGTGLAMTDGATSIPGAGPVVGSGTVPQARDLGVAPPLVPLSGTSTNVNPGTSGTVSRGGRNYAAP